MSDNFLKQIATSKIRIPIKYRQNKEKARELINNIKQIDIEVVNPDIFILANWIQESIGTYDSSEIHTCVESIDGVGEEDVFDISVPNEESYVGNGMVLHNCNLPNDVSEEVVEKVYIRAWQKGCKGFTVYRDGCRAGVLISEKKNTIPKTKAPKRPKVLPCDIYHTTSKGESYFVIVGTFGDDPYEVFAGKNGHMKKSIKHGLIKKVKRGTYSLSEPDGTLIQGDISKYIQEDQEAITRMMSSSLRHGCDVGFVVHQLEKTTGDLQSFAKAISRVLKKYILEGTHVHGEECPNCNGKLVRQEGCMTCLSCLWARCG
jgi:ribonucleoside-diphosphate reductase alpha chain